MEEKRKFPRFTMEVEVHWKKISGTDERTAQHISHAKDASLGGICLVLSPSIAAGDILQLEIRLPGTQGIFSKGKVVWINPRARVKGRTSPVCEGGVEFLDMSDADRKEIDYYIGLKGDFRGRK